MSPSMVLILVMLEINSSNKMSIAMLCERCASVHLETASGKAEAFCRWIGVGQYSTQFIHVNSQGPGEAKFPL
jgi:hypothetical protein